MESTVETKFVDLPIRNLLTSEAAALHQLAGESGAVIAGGFARYAAGLRSSSGDDDDDVPGYSDVDIWPLLVHTTPHAAVKKLEAGLRHLGYDESYRTEAAITFTDSWAAGSRVQIIHSAASRWYADAEAVLREFDFTICQAALADRGTEVVVRASEAFVTDEPRRVLRLARLQNPVRVIGRAMKYARRGYRLPIPQIAALLTQWTPEAREAWDAEMAEMVAASGEDALTDTVMEELGYQLARRTGIAC